MNEESKFAVMKLKQVMLKPNNVKNPIMFSSRMKLCGKTSGCVT